MNDPNLRPKNHSKDDAGNSNNLIRKFVEKTHKVAGVEKLEGFSLGEIFSEIFRKRSEKEIEEYFTVGIESSTPKSEEVDTNWPKPWFFFRTLVGALATYFCFVMAWKEFKNPNLIPGLIMMGSFAIPFSVLIFFFETNVRKNISLYQIIRLVFFGGILSLISSLILFQVSDSLNLNWFGTAIGALIEESGKLAALILVINNRKYPYILNGLLFGAAIGTGFEAFESSGYALQMGLYTNSVNAILDNILLRGIFAPFAHIVWTAMNAAILWKVKGDKKFNFNFLTDVGFLRVFGITIVLHAVWNSPIQLPFYGTQIILGFIAWSIIFSIIQEGLKQLRQEKIAALGNDGMND